jgi:hypothetical protein
MDSPIAYAEDVLNGSPIEAVVLCDMGISCAVAKRVWHIRLCLGRCVCMQFLQMLPLVIVRSCKLPGFQL